MIAIKDITSFLEKEQISYEYYGNKNLRIEGVCPANSIKPNMMTFLRNLQDISKLANLSASNLLIISEFIEVGNRNLLIVDNPHVVFFLLVGFFFKEKPLIEKGIAPTAIVESGSIGNSVTIGHHSFVSKKAIIGNNVTINNNVTITGQVHIGDNTCIDSGAIIGAEGYGHYNYKGQKYHIAHQGGVWIGHDVEIGANTVISRGTLTDTIIESYAKIDSLCVIGHNVVIKERVAVTAGVIVAGSVILEENCRLSINSCIKNGTIVSKDSIVGMGTVVLNEVPEGKVVVGNPGKIIRDKNEIDKKMLP